MTFGLLALIVAAGLAGPLLAGLPRLGLPLVVGEIAAGVLLGRTGLGWIDPDEPTTAFLSEVGFAMLMFVVGTHLPLRDAGMRRAVRPAALGTLLLLALAVPAGFALTAVGPDRPLVLAVVVATSSAAVAMSVLQGLGGNVPAATFATAWITLTDIATILAVPVVLATGALGRVLAGGGLVLLAGVRRSCCSSGCGGPTTGTRCGDCPSGAGGRWTCASASLCCSAWPPWPRRSAPAS